MSPASLKQKSMLLEGMYDMQRHQNKEPQNGMFGFG